MGRRRARDGLALACERLCAYYGLEPIVSPTARQRDDYLRDHPEVRAASIHGAFRDPEVSAVFATIGGDDQWRVIDQV